MKIKVGDLVQYAYDFYGGMLGVVVGKCDMIGADDYFYIQWANGECFPESMLYLKMVKK